MNIILGKDSESIIEDRYLLLTLDTFRVSNQTDPVTSYCVIETLSFEDLSKLEMWRDLHEKLMENYSLQNWDFCEQALEHLQGKWNGELDSFYENLLSRIRIRHPLGVDPSWTHIINR